MKLNKLSKMNIKQFFQLSYQNAHYYKDLKPTCVQIKEASFVKNKLQQNFQKTLDKSAADEQARKRKAMIEELK